MFLLTSISNTDKIKQSQLDSVYPKQDRDRRFFRSGPWPDGQPGRMPNSAGAAATSVALLIALRAQVL
jgi:hypothetical protein